MYAVVAKPTHPFWPSFLYGAYSSCQSLMFPAPSHRCAAFRVLFFSACCPPISARVVLRPLLLSFMCLRPDKRFKRSGNTARTTQRWLRKALPPSPGASPPGAAPRARPGETDARAEPRTHSRFHPRSGTPRHAHLRAILSYTVVGQCTPPCTYAPRIARAPPPSPPSPPPSPF